jgi:hypothetical protein
MSLDTALRRAASSQQAPSTAHAGDVAVCGLAPDFHELDRLAASRGAHVSPEVVLELAQAVAAAPLDMARYAGPANTLSWLSAQPRLAPAAATPATVRAIAEAIAAAGRAAAAAPSWETCTDAPAAVCPCCHPYGPHVTLAKHAALLGGALLGRQVSQKRAKSELFVVVLQVRGAAIYVSSPPASATASCRFKHANPGSPRDAQPLTWQAPPAPYDPRYQGRCPACCGPCC